MKKINIISLKENIIEKTTEFLYESENLSNTISVFPGIRPAHFLRKYLYEKNKKSLKSPLIFSINNFINFVFETLNLEYRNAEMLDLVYLLYEDFNNSENKKLIKDFNLNAFLPWAFKIINDFEELKIENLKEIQIKDYDFLISEKDIKDKGYLNKFRNFNNKINIFSNLYKNFYKKLYDEKMYTRAMKYKYVLDNFENFDFLKYEKIIFSGFFALTNIEKEIFKKIYKLNNSFFFYSYSPLLKDKLSFADNFILEEMKDYKEETKLMFFKALNAHEEIFKLKEILSEKDKINHNDVIVSAKSDIGLPLIENLLYDIEKFNIALGFPLKLSPLYSLFILLKGLFEYSNLNKNNKYSLDSYFKVTFHPYIKNLKLNNNKSEDTRKLFQDLKEKFTNKKVFYISLEEIENEKEYLKEINNLIIRPFENIKNIKDFTDKIIKLIDIIKTESTASLHPYFKFFPDILIDNLNKVQNSKIINLSFENPYSYFNFLNNYVNTLTHPFKGTPIEGLQILGFLESRNLKFNNVYILDVNEGVLPNLKKEDTILPHFIREKLKISTYKTAFEIYSYYFEGLIFSSKNAYIFYLDNKENLRSSFLEKIIWDKEKKKEEIKEEKIFLDVNFSQKENEKIKKTLEMKNFLKNISYSFSSIDTYLQCQVKFYYKYILGIKEYKDINDEIENNDIGNYIHKILFDFFCKKRNEKIFINTNKEKFIKEIEYEIDDFFNKELGEENNIEVIILKYQTKEKLKQYLKYNFDKYENLQILFCEKTYESKIKVDDMYIKLNAKIDRIDELNNKIYLRDYKVSDDYEKYLPNKKYKKEDLENKINLYEKIGSLQLIIYIYNYLENNKEKRLEDINASIILLKTKEILEGFLYEEKENINKLYESYIEGVKEILKDIINNDFFVHTTKRDNCNFCPYKTFCYKN